MPDRYFIALIPPQPIQDYANAIQQDFSDRFASRAAQKSPPHITLQAPFEWHSTDLEPLQTALQQFVQTQALVPVTLSGYAAFPPRVIYLNVLKTPELLDLQHRLMHHLEGSLGLVDPRAKQRPFTPHLTVAFRDLSRQNFQAAWAEYQTCTADFAFTATDLILLRHNGQRWNPDQTFPFLGDRPPSNTSQP